MLHKLLLAAENPPQAAGPGGFLIAIPIWFARFVYRHPAVGVPIALVVSVLAGLAAAGAASTPLRKVGWGIVWFLGSAVLFIVMPELVLLRVPTWAWYCVWIVVIGLIAVSIYLIVDGKRRTRFKKGTAQVLSVETMTKTEGPDPRYMCLIALRVEIPGRPPYDATSSSGGFMCPAEIAAMQPGKTVAVKVDPANPQNVRIDFNQPIR